MQQPTNNISYQNCTASIYLFYKTLSFMNACSVVLQNRTTLQLLNHYFLLRCQYNFSFRKASLEGCKPLITYLLCISNIIYCDPKRANILNKMRIVKLSSYKTFLFSNTYEQTLKLDLLNAITPKERRLPMYTNTSTYLKTHTHYYLHSIYTYTNNL